MVGKVQQQEHEGAGYTESTIRGQRMNKMWCWTRKIQGTFLVTHFLQQCFAS